MANDEPVVRQIYDGVELELNHGDFQSTDSSAGVIYVVSNVNDDIEAILAAWNAAPDYYGGTQEKDFKDGIPKSGVSVNERSAEHIWKIEVKYSYGDTDSKGNTEDDDDAEDDDNEPTTVNLTCSSTTAHIVWPYYQKHIYNRSGSLMPDSQARTIPIGWNGKVSDEMEAAGVDVQKGELNLVIRKRKRVKTVLSRAWMVKMLNAVGCVNGNIWQCFDPGEVMFMGVDYEAPFNGERKVFVTFNFQIRPNEKNVAVGGVATGVNLNGHDYAWANYKQRLVGNTVLNQTENIYIARVHRYIDFGIFGLDWSR